MTYRSLAQRIGCAVAAGVLLFAVACADPGSPSFSSPTAPGIASTNTDPNPPEEPPPPPPTGGEGCTPGYWKAPQHADSWPAPYTTNTLFSSVFDDAFPGMTLDQVLGLGGGGLNALGRHTVAALLSAQSAGVDYDLTSAQVISAFNAVYPDGDYESLKNMLAAFNEQGCSLD